MKMPRVTVKIHDAALFFPFFSLLPYYSHKSTADKNTVFTSNFYISQFSRSLIQIWCKKKVERIAGALHALKSNGILIYEASALARRWQSGWNFAPVVVEAWVRVPPAISTSEHLAPKGTCFQLAIPSPAATHQIGTEEIAGVCYVHSIMSVR